MKRLVWLFFIVIELVISVASAHPVWQETGFLREPRTSHTATLLLSGKVLVTGGQNESGVLGSCELYDPKTGKWELTSALQDPRYQHTATLLPSGKVLVVGGRDDFEHGEGGGEKLASVEIYDEESGTWNSASSLIHARNWHTANLLESGEVLVIGGEIDEIDDPGEDEPDPRTSTEIYDPIDDSWRLGKSLNFARYGHTSTLLQSGEILVVGGMSSGGISPALTVEINDPSDDSTTMWRRVADIPNGRMFHTATLLRADRVLVAGGQTSTSNAGGSSGATEISCLYWLSQDTWNCTAADAARQGHTAALLPSGKVIVFGGFSSSTGNTSEGQGLGCEIYDPGLGFFDLVQGTWSDGGCSTGFRSTGRTATVLASGDILLAGGDGFGEYIGEGTVANAELYSADPGLWADAGSLASPRVRHSAVLLETGEVLVSGGDAAADHDEIYGDGPWTTTDPLDDRSSHTATRLLSGEILAAGGGDFGELFAISRLFDPEARSWRDSGALVHPRKAHTATLLPSGEVLVIGGVDDIGNPIESAELYCPPSDGGPCDGAWRLTAEHPEVPRLRHTATLLHSGKVLVAGGFQGAGRSAEIYDPETDGWAPTGDLNTPRQFHTATLLPSGAVLVVGGSEPGGATQHCEIYDPVTGSWRDTAFLAKARAGHTATLLPSGKVLVVGGEIEDELPDEEGQLPGPVATAEIYDPATEKWVTIGPLTTPRYFHSATLLTSGDVLIVGGEQGFDFPNKGGSELGSSEIYQTNGFFCDGFCEGEGCCIDLPEIDLENCEEGESPVLAHGTQLIIEGDLRGGSEASSGHTASSAVNYPLVHLRDLDGRRHMELIPEVDNPCESKGPGEPFGHLVISRLPASLDPGPHLLYVTVAGIPSQPVPIHYSCNIAVTEPLPDQVVVPVGSTATFEVRAEGATSFQWYKDDIAIPGATQSIYTTPPVSAAESGTVYSVEMISRCMRSERLHSVLRVEDDEPPVVEVVSPSGGEYWLLSDPEPKNVQWQMTDNIRICRVDVSLLFSNDGGTTYIAAPEGGGLPATFDQGPDCTNPGENTTSVEYSIPSAPPSGTTGSLYKIEVRVTDHVGQVTTRVSQNPFFIVQPNNDSVKTLILSNISRMQDHMNLSNEQVADLGNALQQLADHPRVQGVVADLDTVTSIQDFYMAWDAASGSIERANAVLFGDDHYDGIHDHLLNLLDVFPAVEYVVLVGDDRILPMARILDRTVIFPESNYVEPDNGDLTADGTTVGRALAQDYYLSDDPLAMLDPVDLEELDDTVFIPDLTLGRLVERPEDIIVTIATFISQDGILDLSDSDHKVQITGYDFLNDSARWISERWRDAFTPEGDSSPPPGFVDDELLGQSWNTDDLVWHLCGNGGEPYGILNLNGHATHYLEGVPGSYTYDIQGLDTELLTGDLCSSGPLQLSGSVVYSVGCHSGLPVAGSVDPADNPLDLPETFLSLGVQAYVANTGYGWGLEHGIGYSEQLMTFMTEELAVSGTVSIGQAVQNAKLRYFLFLPRLGAYAHKTLMQWALFGLPMYAVNSGIVDDDDDDSQNPVRFDGPPQALADLPAIQRFGDVVVEQRVSGALTDPQTGGESGTPPFISIVNSNIDFSAVGVYRKFDISGEELDIDEPCPTHPEGEPQGCWYALNGLTTGSTDRALQPYFVYGQQLSNTSQHGALWLGGVFDQEDEWTPVFAELVSNGRDVPNDTRVAPRIRLNKPNDIRVVRGEEPVACRPSDLEVNSLVVTAGEVLKNQTLDLEYDIQRTYREMDFDIFFYNNTVDGSGNCDRQGPTLGDGPFASGEYHRVEGIEVEWAVPAEDDEDEVWRVVVVYEDGTLNEDSQGEWRPIELEEDGEGLWRASRSFPEISRLTYVIQAVDTRGNVTWLDFVGATLPDSGVPLGLPLPIDVAIEASESDLLMSIVDTPDPVQIDNPLIYTIGVDNQGPDVASLVTVEMVIPDGTQFGGVFGTDWACQQAGDEIECFRDVLAVGAAPPISLAVIAPSDPGEIQLTVCVSAHGDDSETCANESSETTTVVGIADLALSASSTPEVVKPGDPIAYSLTVTNKGPSVVSEVVVTAPVPEGTVLDSTAGCAEDPIGAGVCSLGPVDVGSTVEYSLTLTVGPSTTDPIVLEATVSSEAMDPDLADNHASEWTEVDAEPPVVTLVGADVGVLNTCEVVDVEVRELHVGFSEEMWDPPGDSDPDDATHPENYQLLASGEDQDFSTGMCSMLIGDDDVPVLVEDVTYGGAAAIVDFQGEVLDDALYRLMVCGSTSLYDLAGHALDGDGDGDGGDDHLFTFRVDRHNHFANGHLDCDLAGWTQVSTQPEEITHSDVDVDDSSVSGSIRISNLTASTDFAVEQCVDVTPGVVDTFEAEIRLDAEPGVEVTTSRSCEYFAESGCQGASLSLEIETWAPLTDTGGVWEERTSSLTAPSRAISARCDLKLSTPKQESFDAYVDALSLSFDGPIFSDGFESGNTDAW